MLEVKETNQVVEPETITVTDENVDELYQKLASGEGFDEPDEDNESEEDYIPEEETTEEVTPELPEEQTKEKTPVEPEPVVEEEETPETLREKVRVADSRHKASQGILATQSQELYNLKSQLGKVQPLLNVFQTDPVKAQQLLNVLTESDKPISEEDVDWTEPASIRKFVESSTEKKFAEIQRRQIVETQKQQQQRFVNELAARMQAERTQKATDGMSQEEITTAEKQFMMDYFGGKGVDMAVKYANYDTAITEAEKRGAEKERNKIKQLGNEPKRVSAVSSGKSNTNVSKKVSEMNEIELEKFTNSPAFAHPGMDLIKQVERRMKQVYRITDD